VLLQSKNDMPPCTEHPANLCTPPGGFQSSKTTILPNSNPGLHTCKLNSSFLDFTVLQHCIWEDTAEDGEGLIAVNAGIIQPLTCLVTLQK